MIVWVSPGRVPTRLGPPQQGDSAFEVPDLHLPRQAKRGAVFCLLFLLGYSQVNNHMYISISVIM